MHLNNPAKKESAMSIFRLCIVIDSALQEAYQGTTLMNDHMNGEFPRLKPGANAISWTGTLTKVVIQPNWRFL